MVLNLHLVLTLTLRVGQVVNETKVDTMRDITQSTLE